MMILLESSKSIYSFQVKKIHKPQNCPTELINGKKHFFFIRNSIFIKIIFKKVINMAQSKKNTKEKKTPKSSKKTTSKKSDSKIIG